MSENKELVQQETQGLVRTVASVTLEIQTLQAQAERIVLGYIIEIGRRLVEVKTMVGHGGWGEYLKNEVNYSQSTADNYIKIFEEYGAGQQSLFGGEANSQALGNLPYTKALRLLALPAEEREAFAEKHDVAGMSTRELEAAIKERDAAIRQAEEAETERKHAEQSQQKMAEDIAMANQRMEQLQAELEEIRSRPVEIAVESADPQELEAARAEAQAVAEQSLRAEIAQAEEARKKAEEKLEKAKADLKAEKEAKGTAAEQVKVAQAAAEQAQAEAAKARRELAASGSKEVASFGIYFETTQNDFSKMLDSLQRLRSANATEQHNKLLIATKKLLEALEAQLPDALEGGG